VRREFELFGGQVQSPMLLEKARHSRRSLPELWYGGLVEQSPGSVVLKTNDFFLSLANLNFGSRINGPRAVLRNSGRDEEEDSGVQTSSVRSALPRTARAGRVACSWMPRNTESCDKFGLLLIL
jgi:hypothetical protein